MHRGHQAGLYEGIKLGTERRWRGRERGSKITWRKSSRTVSAPPWSRFGHSSFTRDLGVIWRCRGQRRIHRKLTRNCFCFHWFASKLALDATKIKTFLDAGRINLTPHPNWFSVKSVCRPSVVSWLRGIASIEHQNAWSKVILQRKSSSINQLLNFSVARSSAVFVTHWKPLSAVC